MPCTFLPNFFLLLRVERSPGGPHHAATKSSPLSIGKVAKLTLVHSPGSRFKVYCQVTLQSAKQSRKMHLDKTIYILLNRSHNSDTIIHRSGGLLFVFGVGFCTRFPSPASQQRTCASCKPRFCNFRGKSNVSDEVPPSGFPGQLGGGPPGQYLQIDLPFRTFWRSWPD